MKALCDVAVMVDGPQGVGKGGEARVEMEKLYVESTGDEKEEIGYYDPPGEVIPENIEEEKGSKKVIKKDVEVNDELDKEDDNDETVDDFNNRFDAWCENVMLGVLAVRGASPNSYGTLKVELQNQCNLENNQYPETLSAATRVLQNCIGNKGARTKTRLLFDDGEKNGVSFLQSELKPTSGTDGKIHPSISCYYCRKKRYYRSHCPAKEEEEEEHEETQLLHIPEDETYLTDNSDTSREGYNVRLLQAFYLMSKIKG